MDDEFTPRRPGQRRVVSIADSFGVGVVPHALHHTTVAERALGDVEVLNLGVPDIGPPQYLQLLEGEGLALEPDLVLVHLFAGNDLELGTARPRERGLGVARRDAVMLYVVVERLGAILRERGRGGLGADELAERLGGGVEGGLSLDELAERLPHLADPMLEPPTYSPERFLELETARARRACGPGDADYARLGEELDALRAAAGDVPLALVVIPDEFQVDDALWQDVLAASGEGSLERDRFQREVRAWAEERGVPLCDLLEELREVEPWRDGRPHLFHLRDTHFNTRGNRAAGEAVARFLARILPALEGASGGD